ncbi:MAG TPA: Uma2 family endonuclease [Thermomicrobiales bacterium]|jgi:Uma2 family endonuclease|nr:Uma2 family endonuclease [Thermomicrobiales bacterium]
MVAAPLHRATLADLDRTPDDGRRYEIIDGELIVSASPSLRHQSTVMEIAYELRTWVRQHELGIVVPAPFDIVVDQHPERTTVVQPDVVFVSTAKLVGVDENDRFHGIPDLVVEVISPTSQGYDSVTKLLRYLRSAVPEYWLVDPRAETFIVMRVEGDSYVPVEPDADGRLTSAVLSGLKVDPAAIFAAARRGLSGGQG